MKENNHESQISVYLPAGDLKSDSMNSINHSVQNAFDNSALPETTVKSKLEIMTFTIHCEPPESLEISDQRYAMILEIINTLCSSALAALTGSVDSEEVLFVNQLFSKFGLPGTSSGPEPREIETLNQVVDIMKQCHLSIVENQTVSVNKAN